LDCQTAVLPKEYPGLKINALQALQLKDLPGLVRCYRFDSQFSGNPNDLVHLLGLTLGHLSLLQIQVVFKTHAGVTTDQEGLGAYGELRPAGHANGELETADQSPGIIHEKNQIFGTWRYLAENSHDELDVNGFLDITRLNYKGHIVNHAGIIDSQFRLCCRFIEDRAVLPHGLERVGKNEILRHTQIHLLPIGIMKIVKD